MALGKGLRKNISFIKRFEKKQKKKRKKMQILPKNNGEILI